MALSVQKGGKILWNSGTYESRHIVLGIVDEDGKWHVGLVLLGRWKLDGDEEEENTS